MLVILVIIILVFVIGKYIFGLGQSNESALTQALRRTSYDYVDKQANVIALGANVIDHQNKIIIGIPTRGLWQFSTNPEVAQCLMDRVNSKEFKRYLDLNFGKDVVFSAPKFEQNRILIIGTKFTNGHRFGPFSPKSR